MSKAIQKEDSATETITLDSKDLAILNLLQQNARATVKEIAEQVHLSTTPVHERIKRMEANGVIKQYATLVDHTKVKKGLMVICYVSLKEHNKIAGVKFIKAIQAMNQLRVSATPRFRPLIVGQGQVRQKEVGLDPFPDRTAPHPSRMRTR